MKDKAREIKREKDSHKGENGKIAVVAGSKDYTGAPAHVAKAAYRTGADLVKIITSEEISGIVAGYSENFIIREYKGKYFGKNSIGNVLEKIKWSDIAIVGPGLSKPNEEALKKVFKKADKPFIIDAEAIKPAIEENITGCIITPHRQEKNHIIDKYNSLKEFSQKTGNIIVKKGRNDKIYSPGEETLELNTGNPGMTVGGTGDILTGIIGSLYGQGLSKKEAAEVGVKINGEAGDKAWGEKGNGLIPQDIIRKIPEVFKNHSNLKN